MGMEESFMTPHENNPYGAKKLKNLIKSCNNETSGTQHKKQQLDQATFWKVFLQHQNNFNSLNFLENKTLSERRSTPLRCDQHIFKQRSTWFYCSHTLLRSDLFKNISATIL